MIIGDGPPATKVLEQVLTHLGHVVCATATADERAIEMAGKRRPDLLLVDLHGNASGIRFITESQKLIDIPAVYLVDPADLHIMQRTSPRNSIGYVFKPIIEQQLAMNISVALSMSKKEHHYRRQIFEINRSLNESKSRLRLLETILRSISDGVVATSLEGEFLLVNSVAKEISGMEPVDTGPESWSEAYGTFYPDGKTQCPTEDLPLVRAMNGETVNDVQLILRNQNRPDGVSISVNGRPLMDESGTMTGGVIILRDISQLTATEKRLEESLAQARDHSEMTAAILDAVGDPILAIDSSGKTLLINAAARELIQTDITNRPFDQLAQKYEVFHLDKVTPVALKDLPLDRAIRGEVVEKMEIYIREVSGPGRLILSVTGRPFSIASGSKSGGVVVLRDISQRVLAQQAIVEAFSEGRLEILETIVHNIGNLVNHAAIGISTIETDIKEKRLLDRLSSVVRVFEVHKDDLATFLKDDPRGQKSVEFLSALNRDLRNNNEELISTIERVNKAISQIVNIVRSERSAKHQLFKDVEISVIINESLKMLRHSLDKRGIDVGVTCENIPAMIRIQETRLYQLIVNLVKNAIEAIDEFKSENIAEVEPRIEIRCYTDGQDLILDIIDNGIGIDSRHKPELFRAGFTTKVSGTGLGLHSAANFVVATGGRIEAISGGIGKGSTFRVRLSLKSIATG